MKALLVALTLSTASPVWAAAFTANPVPASPVVIDSNTTDDNGDEVKGSWFRVSFDLENTSIEQMQISTVTVELRRKGSIEKTEVFNVNDYISSNSTSRIGPFYLQALHIGTAGYTFDVDAKITGYSADDEGQPTGRIDQTVRFQTQ